MFALPHPTQASRRQQGFNLYEVVVCLVIVSILAGLGGPNFVRLMNRGKVESIRDELVASFTLARLEAIKNRTPVLLHRLTDCDEPGEDNAAWNCGWRMVLDTNRNGQGDPSDRLLQVSRLPPGLSMVRGQKSSQLRMTTWGATSPLAERFVISSTQSDPPDTLATLCLSSGGRLRTVWAQGQCPDAGR